MACCSSWKTFSCRSRSRVTSAIDPRPRASPRACASPSGRTRMPQPARRRAVGAGDAHLFLQPLAFARRLEQPVDRLGHIGIADEDPLDRPHVLRARRAGQLEIGGVGVDDVAARIGDHEAVEGVVDDRTRAADLRRRCRRSRRMPAASANSENTPTIARSASSARM